jgi:hypothetical protein
VIKATADIVAVASHVDNDHGTIEVVENGEKVKRCSIYPNLSCEDHVRTSAVGTKYLKGRFAAPANIWCDAAGKEIFRKSGYVQPEPFLEDVKSALEKVPGKRISKEEYDRQAVPLEQAEAALSAGKYKAAIEGFTAAAKGSIEGLRKLAETGLDNIDRNGRQLLTRAKSALNSGRKDQAREALALLAGEFAAFECGREAVELLKKVDGDGGTGK